MKRKPWYVICLRACYTMPGTDTRASSTTFLVLTYAFPMRCRGPVYALDSSDAVLTSHMAEPCSERADTSRY
eukprot:3140010-Rhodomonas_salina.2